MQKIGTTNLTMWNISSLSEGTYYWQVSTYNGLYTTNSSIFNFTVCNPGSLGTPSLFSESVDNVVLNWTISCYFPNSNCVLNLKGSDHCSEDKSADVAIWQANTVFWSTTVSEEVTSLVIDSSDASYLFESGDFYNWTVTAVKGGQTKTATKNFTYCLRASPIVHLNAPGM